jgi:hypothetical protein
MEAESFFTPLQRIINANERAFHRALADLERPKKSRNQPKPTDTKTTSAESALFPRNPLPPDVGFVPPDDGLAGGSYSSSTQGQTDQSTGSEVRSSPLRNSPTRTAA